MSYECEAIRLPAEVSARVAFGYLTVDGDNVECARMLRQLADTFDHPNYGEPCLVCGKPGSDAFCGECRELGQRAGSTEETCAGPTSPPALHPPAQTAPERVRGT